MNVAIIDGNLGSGKTLGMSIIANDFAKKSGCQLYSNYGMKTAKPFRTFEDFKTIAEEEHSILCLDEAHVDLDSRNFNTNAVKFFTHLIFYLRKLRCTIFITSPDIDNVESRVRSLCNLYIHVHKSKTHYIYDMYDLQSEKFLKTKRIKKEKAHDFASQIYDTYKMVTPLEFPAKQDEFKKFLFELETISTNYYLEQAEKADALKGI